MGGLTSEFMGKKRCSVTPDGVMGKNITPHMMLVNAAPGKNPRLKPHCIGQGTAG